MGRAMRKRVYGDMRKRRPRSACAFAQSNQGLHCTLTESLYTTECMSKQQRQDDSLRMRSIIWICAFCACTTALVCSTRAKWLIQDTCGYKHRSRYTFFHPKSVDMFYYFSGNIYIMVLIRSASHPNYIDTPLIWSYVYIIGLLHW